MTDEEHDDWMEKSLLVISRILQVPREMIYLKLRQRKPGRLGQYQRSSGDGMMDHEFEVEENGLRFIVNLGDYLDTGLFLDHRVTRQLVRTQGKDKKVLNLFAYTGSFSVYAAAGGASSVTTVDLSNTYLRWAERNFQINGLPTSSSKHGNHHVFIQADVLQFIKAAPSAHFDLVILDPPTFSNSKRMDDFLEIQRDHVQLINDTLRCMVKGGLLYFSTNYTKFILEEKSIQASSIRDITAATTPFDFAGRLSRYCFLIQK